MRSTAILRSESSTPGRDCFELPRAVSLPTGGSLPGDVDTSLEGVTVSVSSDPDVEYSLFSLTTVS